MGLENETGKLLTSRGLTLAVAESCTGGLLGSLITSVPGSSDYFVGGVVAYANRAKERLLGVPGGLIASHGAVSREVALAMARGAQRALDADIAISTTGIAGPGGATDLKPVGLVYIALVAGDYAACQELRFQGTRQQIRKQAADTALALLHAYLTDGRGAP